MEIRFEPTTPPPTPQSSALSPTTGDSLGALTLLDESYHTVFRFWCVLLVDACTAAGQQEFDSRCVRHNAHTPALVGTIGGGMQRQPVLGSGVANEPDTPHVFCQVQRQNPGSGNRRPRNPSTGYGLEQRTCAKLIARDNEDKNVLGDSRIRVSSLTLLVTN